MSRLTWLAAAIALAITLAGGALFLRAHSHSGVAPLPPRPSAKRPTLLLLTTLPIVFSEQFELDGGSPALIALESRYRVRPINVAQAPELARGRLLLMAHPLAQPAEALVELDRWVRAGGRVLLLADPLLEWPSDRPLGDLLRPPPMFADTGLLAHWGLSLTSPDARGPQTIEVDGRAVTTVSPGRLRSANRDCAIVSGGLIARCKIGRGRASIVADADILNVEDSRAPNLQMLLAELGRIER